MYSGCFEVRSPYFGHIHPLSPLLPRLNSSSKTTTNALVAKFFFYFLLNNFQFDFGEYINKIAIFRIILKSFLPTEGKAKTRTSVVISACLKFGLLDQIPITSGSEQRNKSIFWSIYSVNTYGQSRKLRYPGKDGITLRAAIFEVSRMETILVRTQQARRATAANAACGGMPRSVGTGTNLVPTRRCETKREIPVDGVKYMCLSVRPLLLSLCVYITVTSR